MSTTVSTSVEQALAPTGEPWPWWLLRAVSALTTLTAVTQAFLAGGVVAGRTEVLALPSVHGLLLATGTVALVSALVLAWRKGGGPAWTLAAGLLMSLATAVQLELGVSRSLSVSVPLGTTMLLAQVMLLIWVWQRPLPSSP